MTSVSKKGQGDPSRGDALAASMAHCVDRFMSGVCPVALSQLEKCQVRLVLNVLPL